MDIADFRLVLEVHLMGSVHCSKAVWNGMRERRYGRIVFTTSSSGLGPELVSPAILALVEPRAPTRRILLAGAGSFEQANITMTRGLYLCGGPSVADELANRLEKIAARDGETIPESGGFQYQYEVDRAFATSQPSGSSKQ